MEYPIVAIAKRTFDALIMRRGDVSRKQEPRKPSPLSQRERGTIALSPFGGELERGSAGMRPSANHRLPPMFHHFSNKEQA
ncbi:MAG: hypothetical protein ACYC2E_00730 [Sulfuricella sp.]